MIDGVTAAFASSPVLALLFQAAACEPPPGYQVLAASARLDAGSAYTVAFGNRFRLDLAPTPTGWIINVLEVGRSENLANLTPPWHTVPNPRFIEGWHFRNASNTGPNDGSVNAPQDLREFIFSPEVGRTLQYAGSGTRPETVEEVARFGKGWLKLTDYALTTPTPNQKAGFTWITFDVCLRWTPPVPE